MGVVSDSLDTMSSFLGHLELVVGTGMQCVPASHWSQTGLLFNKHTKCS